MVDYETHISAGGGLKGKPSSFRNNDPLTMVGYYPDGLTREAIRCIREPRSRPFFLFLSQPLPHDPLQVPRQWSAPYLPLTGAENATYSGMVTEMDDGIGQVLRAIHADWKQCSVSRRQV